MYRTMIGQVYSGRYVRFEIPERQERYAKTVEENKKKIQKKNTKNRLIQNVRNPLWERNAADKKSGFFWASKTSEKNLQIILIIGIFPDLDGMAICFRGLRFELFSDFVFPRTFIL